jgi:hypothetical protein
MVGGQLYWVDNIGVVKTSQEETVECGSHILLVIALEDHVSPYNYFLLGSPQSKEVTRGPPELVQHFRL